ncbi:hypothetical protein J6590_075204 [Homalodisca vitripennis]|nr:hypothetical protein J6590_075204 [Homalodisca vitripennis]
MTHTQLFSLDDLPCKPVRCSLQNPYQVTARHALAEVSVEQQSHPVRYRRLNTPLQRGTMSSKSASNGKRAQHARSVSRGINTGKANRIQLLCQLHACCLYGKDVISESPCMVVWQAVGHWLTFYLSVYCCIIIITVLLRGSVNK